jgi:hypothetical protein
MCMSKELERGDIAYDVENEDWVIVIERTDEHIDEYRYSWTWNKKPKFVSDAEKNSDYPADNITIKAVYVNAVLSIEDDWDGTVESVEDYLSENNVKEYAFPEDRLTNPRK